MWGTQASASESAAGALSFGGGNSSDSEIGPGSVGRAMLIIWLVAAAWLVLVWRVVEGY